MGRTHLSLLPGWEDCYRCEREETRLGVLARAWPANVQVVVMGMAASRGAQACGGFDPALLRLVEFVRERLALGGGECQPDVLLACGLGGALPDHAAACSSRFRQQPAAARPRVILLQDAHVERLAIGAGLVQGGTWSLAGGMTIPVVRCSQHGAHGALAALSRSLGRPLVRPVRMNRQPLVARAQNLLDALGKHAGRAVLPRGRTQWRRTGGASLTLADLEHHLAGKMTVAPFRPTGEWPYIVVDVDRHNAIQERHFDATRRQIQQLLPHAFEITSSPSGGRHYYVRLPGGVTYERGALVVGAYLALRGARWGDAGKVRAERAEVPVQPVRLPFGTGSCIPGSSKPLEAQMDEFLRFLSHQATGDYAVAVRAVTAHLRLRGRYSPEQREKIRRFVGAAEVQGLRHLGLEPDDPWASLLSSLPKELRTVAAGGVPFYGTRTRWTLALVRALSERTGPEQAKALMLHWVHHRTHASETITTDIGEAEAQTLAAVDKIYRNAGVPKRAWEFVKSKLDSLFWARRQDDMFWWPIAERLKRPNALRRRTTVKTAFRILRGFYRRGVCTRRVNWREFYQFAGKNRGRDTERLLATGSWLNLDEQYVPEVRSRMYSLHPSLWPPRPGEERVFSP